ncbi:asparagine synthase (glutamine-hydrolyzing), partial [Frankia sp. Cpl3]|nr:asparagine synthase (glutamine-hydrolyzing) [Frankia sp. Cpl3]
ITGWVDFEKDLTSQLHIAKAMTQTLANRGPDAEGYWISGPVAFGHRRLVVVDPAGGLQPMTKYRGDYAYSMVYNGELYNTEEIRAELKAHGHQFRSHSDTEVLLSAYIEWGEDCVERLNGIFAFAIWDERRHTLFLARDRMGVKPLFYAERGSSFIFGSELKAVLAHPAVKPVINREGLAEVFVMGPARSPGHGVFRDIREVRPGFHLTVNRAGVHARRYWQLVSRPHTDDLTRTTRQVCELLVDSIERQLVADVPVATLLSGGLDSSAITAIAAEFFRREGRGTLHTYSIDYVDN